MGDVIGAFIGGLIMLSGMLAVPFLIAFLITKFIDKR